MENKEFEMKNLVNEELEKAVGGDAASNLTPPPKDWNPNDPNQRTQPQFRLVGYKTRCSRCGKTMNVMKRPAGVPESFMYCCGWIMQVVEPIFE